MITNIKPSKEALRDLMIDYEAQQAEIESELDEIKDNISAILWMLEHYDKLKETDYEWAVEELDDDDPVGEDIEGDPDPVQRFIDAIVSEGAVKVPVDKLPDNDADEGEVAVRQIPMALGYPAKPSTAVVPYVEDEEVVPPGGMYAAAQPCVH